ncbi:MAG: MAPEG family protein [Shewanella sp.]|nr:MAPEG family protein [Shewanella sp.]MCF1430792.1 MAPEG family protein [Shewanella sp.]MCF1458571.1 MAPEG family protein [Shewanella sp.]
MHLILHHPSRYQDIESNVSFAAGVGLGIHGSKQLQVADRVHGNLLDNAPLVLLLMLLAELGGFLRLYLVILGSLWLSARVMYAVGFSRGRGVRFWRVLLT